MVSLKEEDFELIASEYKSMSAETLEFYYNKIMSRVEYLTPLVKELEEKGYNIYDISKDLGNEILRCHLALTLIERFIKV